MPDRNNWKCRWMDVKGSREICRPSKLMLNSEDVQLKASEI